MSMSGSDSGSFSSSEAIIAHFDEAAGSLSDGGFHISEHAWTSITHALRDETIDSIAFWGIDGDEGRTLLKLVIDWGEHEVAVESGNVVKLPIADGTITLLQVRRAAAGFLRAYQARGLRGTLELTFRPGLQDRTEELAAKYGWTTRPAVRRGGPGAGWSLPSRYHGAVIIEAWFGD